MAIKAISVARSQKLKLVDLCYYVDGWPPGKTRHCKPVTSVRSSVWTWICVCYWPIVYRHWRKMNQTKLVSCYCVVSVLLIVVDVYQGFRAYYLTDNCWRADTEHSNEMKVLFVNVNSAGSWVANVLQCVQRQHWSTHSLTRDFSLRQFSNETAGSELV